MACHIYSASRDGPRGWGDKDETFIGSSENGLWCCAPHGGLIDKNSGEGYPVEVLFAWKALAEARVTKLLNDVPSPLGWVDTIELTKFPGVSKQPKLKLWRFTLLAGVGQTGETSLLESAASVSHSEYLNRFVSDKFDNPPMRPQFAARVTYSTVDTVDKWVDVEAKGSFIVRKEKNQPCLLPPGDLEIVYCGNNDLRWFDHEDDLDYLARILKVDRSALYAIAAVVDWRLCPGAIEFRQGVETDDDDPDVQRSRRKPNGERYIEACILRAFGTDTVSVTLGGLSTSERGRLIVSLLIAKARQISEQRLTLLVVEDPISNFDKGNFLRLLDVIKDQPFQAIVCIPQARRSEVIEVVGDRASLKAIEHLQPWRLCWLPESLYEKRDREPA